MGWAGPAQPTGPDSAQNCWADFGPRWVGPISAQKKLNIIFWARPGPEDRTGPGSAWPKPKRGGGNYFPPTLHAERYSFCMQGMKRKKNKREEEGEEKLPGAEAEAVACCVSGGAVVEAGSGVAAPWRRLQAAALLSQAAERGILPLSFSSVSFPFLLFLWFSFPLFSLLSVLFFLYPFSLFRFFLFSSLSSVFFRFLLLPPPFSSPFCCRVGCYL